MNDKQRVVDRLLGKEIDVHDWGICRVCKNGTPVFKVEEEDGSINWYLNPERSDTILEWTEVEFVRER